MLADKLCAQRRELFLNHGICDSWEDLVRSCEIESRSQILMTPFNCGCYLLIGRSAGIDDIR